MKNRELLENPSNTGMARISWDSANGCLEVLSRFAPSHTFEDPTGVRCTVWGGPSHPDMPRESIPEWLLRESSQGRLEGVCRLLGPFVALIEDPLQRVVTVVTDPLGLMRLFLDERREDTLLATDVWSLAERRAGKLDVDRRSLASWLWFGFNCTSHGLFEGMTLLPPGSVTRIKPGGRTSRSYSPIAVSEDGEDVPAAEVAACVRDQVQSGTATLLRDRPDAILALSGGWDSRLIAASAVEAGNRPLAVSVANSRGEEQIAAEVARHLGLELEVIRPSGEVFDLYPRSFGLTPSGYPITRFVTHEIARRHPGRPLLNGFLGDSLVRGSHDRVQGKFEEEHSEPIVDLLMRTHSMTGGFHLLDSKIAQHVYRLARERMKVAVDEGRALGRIFQWVDLTLRQRFYIANNFLQHLDISEPLLPFYSVELIRMKLVRNPGLFGEALYRKILNGFHPALTAITHSAEPPSPRHRRLPRRVRKMALSMALCEWQSGRGTPVPRRRAYPRLLAALAGRKDMESYVKYMYGMTLLDTRLENDGVSLDWEAKLADEAGAA